MKNIDISYTRRQFDLMMTALAALSEHDLAVAEHAKGRKSARRAVRFFLARKNRAARLQVKMLLTKQKQKR